jgi:hypothetical protein
MVHTEIRSLTPSPTGLREHLLAAGAGQPSVPQSLPQHPHSGSPHAIDPAIGGTPYATMSADDGHDLSEGRSKGGRRELSTSKRAAQNRAAQVRVLR